MNTQKRARNDGLYEMTPKKTTRADWTWQDWTQQEQPDKSALSNNGKVNDTK